MPTFINFHTLKKLSLLITFFFATQSSAAEGFYIEPLLGVSEFGVAEVSNFTLSKSSTSKAFLVGYSLNQELAAELGWLVGWMQESLATVQQLEEVLHSLMEDLQVMVLGLEA